MESISRISTLLESARELTLDAAQSARGAARTSSVPKTYPAVQIKKLLDSRHDREVLEGLRKVISMMYRLQPCLPFFSSVVKNVASPDIEIKKLVYIYLLHHAESEPDLALLSINTIQKSLSESDPRMRALALKTMSGIRVPVISQIVSLAIKKGMGDMSPVVRKAAALAVPKCYRLDPATAPILREYLGALMGDKQYVVAGAAVKAFMEVCPDRIDLVHPHYRSLVKKIVDMDEWSQVAVLKMMNIYARMCFPRRSRRVSRRQGNYGTKGVYGDEGDVEDETGVEVQILDLDLELLLKSIKPLLQSRNAAVVVAVARCYITLGTEDYIHASTGPLIALLRGPQDIQYITLYNIVTICLTRPEIFVKYAFHFLVHFTDPPQIWDLKLELLTLIFPHCDTYIKSLILNEIEHFSSGSDKALSRKAVRALGRCAQSDSKTSARCLRLLLNHVTSLDDDLVAEVLTVVRHLIQQDPVSHRNTVIQLAKNLDMTTTPQARATTIWLVGEFASFDGENNIASDVLRILAKRFADEAEPAKLQIVLLAAKVYLHHLNSKPVEAERRTSPAFIQHKPSCEGDEDLAEKSFTDSADKPNPEHPIVLLWNYIILLARYDTSYDLRDRTRLYRALLAVPTTTQLATLMLLAPKPVPYTPSPSASHVDFNLGSASLVIGEKGGPHGLKGYEVLPEWVELGREPDPTLRDGEGGKIEYEGKQVMTTGGRLDGNTRILGDPSRTNAIGGVGATISGRKTLDDWLAEEEQIRVGTENEIEEESGETDESEEEEDSSDNASDADEEEESSEDDDYERLIK